MDNPSASFVEAGFRTVEFYGEVIGILFALGNFVVRHEEFHDVFFFSFVGDCRVESGWVGIIEGSGHGERVEGEILGRLDELIFCCLLAGF